MRVKEAFDAWIKRRRLMKKLSPEQRTLASRLEAAEQAYRDGGTLSDVMCIPNTNTSYRAMKAQRIRALRAQLAVTGLTEDEINLICQIAWL